MGANSASLLWRGNNGVKCCRYPFYRYKRQHHLILTFRNNLRLRMVIGRSVASSFIAEDAGVCLSGAELATGETLGLAARTLTKMSEELDLGSGKSPTFRT